MYRIVLCISFFFFFLLFSFELSNMIFTNVFKNNFFLPVCSFFLCLIRYRTIKSGGNVYYYIIYLKIAINYQDT